MKDSFLASYPSEYIARIKDLNPGSLAPERLQTMIQKAHDQANWTEADAAPGGVDCDFERAVQEMSGFVDARSEWISEWTDTPN